MSKKIVALNNTSRVEPDVVLNAAVGELEEVIVIGDCLDGKKWLSASTADKQKLIWMIEQVKFKLMAGDYD